MVVTLLAVADLAVLVAGIVIEGHAGNDMIGLGLAVAPFPFALPRLQTMAHHRLGQLAQAVRSTV